MAKSNSKPSEHLTGARADRLKKALDAAHELIVDIACITDKYQAEDPGAAWGALNASCHLARLAVRYLDLAHVAAFDGAAYGTFEAEFRLLGQGWPQD